MVVVAVYPLIIIAFPCNYIRGMEHSVFFLAAHCMAEMKLVLLGALNFVLFTSLTSRARYWCVWQR